MLPSLTTMNRSLLRQGYGGQADSCAPLALPSWGWKSLSRWKYIKPSGVCETPCGLRDFVPFGTCAKASHLQEALSRPRQSVYASIMLFPHPSVCTQLPGTSLVTRFPPRIIDGLAHITATLGSLYWLGFETTGLSPDKKRLAYRRTASSPPTADQKTGQLGSGGTPLEYTSLRQTQGAVSG